jgi:uncharacterized membrane protein YgcG
MPWLWSGPCFFNPVALRACKTLSILDLTVSTDCAAVEKVKAISDGGGSSDDGGGGSDGGEGSSDSGGGVHGQFALGLLDVVGLAHK